MPRHICACLLVEHICTGFFSCYCSGCSGDSNGDWMDYGYSLCIVSQSAWRRSCRKLSLWQEPRWQEWLCRQSGWCHFQVTILCRGLVGLLLLITIYVLRKIWKGRRFEGAERDYVWWFRLYDCLVDCHLICSLYEIRNLLTDMFERLITQDFDSL